MLQTIPRTWNLAAPERQTAQEATRLAFFRNRLEAQAAPGKFSISSQSGPTDEDRAAMIARRFYLAERTHGAERVAIEAVVSKLMLVFPSMRGGYQDATEVVGVFAEVLRGLPLWAVRHAADKIATAQSNRNHAFAPSAPELHKAASDLAAPFAVEQKCLGEVLDAEIYVPVDPDQRAQTLAKFHALVKGLGTVGKTERSPPLPAPTEDYFAAIKAENIVNPIKLSTGLLAKMGLGAAA